MHAPADLPTMVVGRMCGFCSLQRSGFPYQTMHANDARSHLGKKSLVSTEKRVTRKNLTEIEASRKSAALGSIIDIFGANRLTRS
jgi:hypothetical protein